MVRTIWIAAIAAIAIAAPCAARTAPGCADVVPGAGAPPREKRALLPEDLVRLRDIGPVDPGQRYAGLFSVSPDGTRAAFQVRQGNPLNNSYCLAIMVVDLGASGSAHVVDRGGDFIRATMEFRGKANFPSGVADPITPRWSPDGSWIAYRRRDKGAVQLWIARADGSASAAITESADDVDDFRISSDGRTIVYATRPALRSALAAIEKEGLSGFHYDDRFSPASSTRPFAPTPIANTTWVFDLASKATRAATAKEAGMLGKSSMQEGEWTEATGPAHAKAWVQVPARTFYPSRGRLTVRIGSRLTSCDAAECADASYPWWAGDKVRFLRREGWENDATAVYEWRPGARRPRRLYSTEDVLLGCVPSGQALTCLREASLQPRRLERLDPASGRRDIVFDPNPEFAGLTLGQVRRLRDTNSFGAQFFADLVLPIGYEPGKHYPLVVVQYASRGFLRGGTGDDYPIQAFANRGFAVLSFDRPEAVGFRTATDFTEVDRINLKDFADRRSVLESLETTVRRTIEIGVADPARIGITGLSDGASTVGFALLHSSLFSAYAMSSCCWDTAMPVRVGPGAAHLFHYMGYPKTTDDSEAAKAFWREIAISPNAQRIRGPILLQVSDDELWSALQSYTALREQDRAIDLYVLPGEHHVKWQPAHRLAVYERSIDWFDFWLNGVRAPGRREEIAHWEILRGQVEKQALSRRAAVSKTE